MNVWLFDLDGVLIRPGGYREALRRTATHYSQAAGYATAPLSEDVIESFEAQGITCEWDICGICAMADIFGIWRANPELHLAGDLAACQAQLRSAELAHPARDYPGWARRVGAFGGETPSAAALQVFKHEAGRAESDLVRTAEFETILSAVLGNPREFSRSPVMQYFQQFTLGSRAYADHYRVLPEVETPSLLAELDRPALSESSRERILKLQRNGSIQAAIITARPCRPQSAGNDTFDYPPEAEIALKLAGLETLPLAGAGQMQWLARRHHQAVDAYLKPSPVHALAALALALGKKETDALESARLLVEEGKMLPPWNSMADAELRILVFEDSPTGVIGTQSAVDLLRRKHLGCVLSICGIATGAEKRAALQSLGARLFETTDAALDEAFRSLDKDRSGPRPGPGGLS
jgi:hypothetical protein